MRGSWAAFLFWEETFIEIRLLLGYGITEFKTMYVYLRNGQTWTPETSGKFARAATEDLEFEGIETIIDRASNI